MKAYKITMEDIDDHNKKIEWYGSIEVLIDMLCCQSCISKTTDAKTGETFTIIKKVLNVLLPTHKARIDVDALSNIDFGPNSNISISKTKAE